MAVYGISQEGIEQFQQLKKDLVGLNEDIESAGKKLITKVSGLQDRLGIYGENILDLVEGVNRTQRIGVESVKDLLGEIDNRVKMIEDFIANCSLG